MWHCLAVLEPQILGIQGACDAWAARCCAGMWGVFVALCQPCLLDFRFPHLHLASHPQTSLWFFHRASPFLQIQNGHKLLSPASKNLPDSILENPMNTAIYCIFCNIIRVKYGLIMFHHVSINIFPYNWNQLGWYLLIHPSRSRDITSAAWRLLVETPGLQLELRTRSIEWPDGTPTGQIRCGKSWGVIVSFPVAGANDKRLLHVEILPEATDIKSRCFICVVEFCNDSIFWQEGAQKGHMVSSSRLRTVSIKVWTVWVAWNSFCLMKATSWKQLVRSLYDIGFRIQQELINFSTARQRLIHSTLTYMHWRGTPPCT